jgi:hypothetical protein
MTSEDYGRPITDVLPMGGLMNVDRTGDPGVRGLVAVGDAFCHTDPAYAYGLSFSLAHAQALARASTEGAEDIGDRHTAAVGDEARERHGLACTTDDARSRHWSGEKLDIGRRDGCYPLFSFLAAIATAPHDDLILRRTIRRIGLLDRTEVFDGDSELHDRIESTFAQLMAGGPPPCPGPPRDELLGLMRGAAVP